MESQFERVLRTMDTDWEQVQRRINADWEQIQRNMDFNWEQVIRTMKPQTQNINNEMPPLASTAVTPSKTTSHVVSPLQVEPQKRTASNEQKGSPEQSPQREPKPKPIYLDQYRFGILVTTSITTFVFALLYSSKVIGNNSHPRIQFWGIVLSLSYIFSGISDVVGVWQGATANTTPQHQFVNLLRTPCAVAVMLYSQSMLLRWSRYTWKVFSSDSLRFDNYLDILAMICVAFDTGILIEYMTGAVSINYGRLHAYKLNVDLKEVSACYCARSINLIQKSELGSWIFGRTLRCGAGLLVTDLIFRRILPCLMIEARWDDHEAQAAEGLNNHNLTTLRSLILAVVAFVGMTAPVLLWKSQIGIICEHEKTEQGRR